MYCCWAWVREVLPARHEDRAELGQQQTREGVTVAAAGVDAIDPAFTHQGRPVAKVIVRWPKTIGLGPP